MNDVYENIQYPTKIPVKNDKGDVIGYVTNANENKQTMNVNFSEPIFLSEGERYGVSTSFISKGNSILATQIQLTTIPLKGF